MNEELDGRFIDCFPPDDGSDQELDAWMESNVVDDDCDDYDDGDDGDDDDGDDDDDDGDGDDDDDDDGDGDDDDSGCGDDDGGCGDDDVDDDDDASGGHDGDRQSGRACLQNETTSNFKCSINSAGACKPPNTCFSIFPCPCPSGCLRVSLGICGYQRVLLNISEYFSVSLNNDQ